MVENCAESEALFARRSDGEKVRPGGAATHPGPPQEIAAEERRSSPLSLSTSVAASVRGMMPRYGIYALLATAANVRTTVWHALAHVRGWNDHSGGFREAAELGPPYFDALTGFG